MAVGLARRMAVFTSMLAASAAVAVAGGGVASAGTPPDVTGQKYSDAQGVISGAGLTAVVSTTVGDQKAWPDCIVTNTVARTVPPPPDSSGSAVSQLLVSLNCDADDASATTPGFSAASPEGKAIKAAADAAAAKAKSSS